MDDVFRFTGFKASTMKFIAETVDMLSDEQRFVYDMMLGGSSSDFEILEFLADATHRMTLKLEGANYD